jgi:hypothetical protein
MTIIRRHLTASYTAIPNDVVSRTDLSIESRWLLVYLLTKPHSWIVRIGDIREAGNIGRDKAYSLIKELVATGYIRRDEVRSEDGNYANVEYTVFDLPFPEMPDTAKPNPVNTELSKYSYLASTEDTIDTSVSIDARSRLWGMARSISTETGIPEQKLRNLIGKWLKTLNDDASALIEVFGAAKENRPSDFVSWVTAAIKSRNSEETETEKWLNAWK